MPSGQSTVGAGGVNRGSAASSCSLALPEFGGIGPGEDDQHQLPAWLDIAALLATLTAAGAALVTWSRRPGWNETHRVAVASGLLLTYAWYGIARQALADEPHAIDVLGNVVLAVGAVTLAYISTQRSHCREPGSTDSGSTDLTR